MIKNNNNNKNNNILLNDNGLPKELIKLFFSNLDFLVRHVDTSDKILDDLVCVPYTYLCNLQNIENKYINLKKTIKEVLSNV